MKKYNIEVHIFDRLQAIIYELEAKDEQDAVDIIENNLTYHIEESDS